jgi:hypothetical protein
MTRPRKGWKRRGQTFRISRIYGFIRSRQLDGTMDKGPKHGTFCLTGVRVQMSWGSVAEHRWPFPRDASIWPPQEPPGLDRIARFNRTFCYFRIRDLADAKRYLYGSERQVRPFVFSVPITRQWYSAPGGIIAMPSSRADFVEGHAVVAVGWSDADEMLSFLNCWGNNWGDRGMGYLPFQYFQTYLTDAWGRHPGETRNWRPTSIVEPLGMRTYIFKRNWIGYPGILIDLWQMEEDIRIGWCIMTYRGKQFLEIEDFFLRPDFQHDDFFHNTLTAEVLETSREQELPLRLWIAHADTRHFAANFKPINDLLRATHLKARPSPFSWAAYVAD